MNISEVSEKGIASIIAVLSICLLLAIITGFLFPDSVGSLTHEIKDFLGLGSGTENSEEAFVPDTSTFYFSGSTFVFHFKKRTYSCSEDTTATWFLSQQ
jgi:hypothetical protein